jgi:ATP-dependent RNA helicase RhlE
MTPTGSFAALDLIEPLQRALATLGFQVPTPIQAAAIPPILAGRDVIGCAQTGTGKTAAFALPILQNLALVRTTGPRKIRVLVLSPTRELASQITRTFEACGRHLGFRSAVLFGGVGQGRQVDALRRGVDVLVATPGRLLDLHDQRHVDLRHVTTFVLDEADRMLDMGFIHDLKRIVGLLPSERQNLLFSATMPRKLHDLVSGFLRSPLRVEVASESPTSDRIDQSVWFVAKPDKNRMLTRILRDQQPERALVFTRTKHGADRLVKHLEREGIDAAAIHGNKSQGARERALENFRRGGIRVLVATDVAARGIDVDGISHVFNVDLPPEPEVYVHRIGRTARIGRTGIAISFCDDGEMGSLRAIERLTAVKLKRAA